MTIAAVSLGSNFSAEKNLNIALQALQQKFPRIKISKAYKTSPVGLVTNDFINLVVLIETELGIEEFFATCQTIEKLVPEENAKKGTGVYTRALDLDVLFFGDFTQTFQQHKLPRPDLLKHNFALRPLAEIYPDGILPTTNLTFAQLWQMHKDESQIMQEVTI